MLLNSDSMEDVREGVVRPIGLGSNGIGRRFGHRSIADTDPSGLLSDDYDFNMLIDGILESSDGSDESIDLDYLARVLSLRLSRTYATYPYVEHQLNSARIKTCCMWAYVKISRFGVLFGTVSRPGQARLPGFFPFVTNEQLGTIGDPIVAISRSS
jgi:hypothetical protein